MSRADGIHVIPDDDVWDISDQAMTYIKLRKIKIGYSPNRQDPVTMWVGISFPTQDVMTKPEGSPQSRRV